MRRRVPGYPPGPRSGRAAWLASGSSRPGVMAARTGHSSVQRRRQCRVGRRGGRQIGSGTVKFGIDCISSETDLSAKNGKKLRKATAPYVKAGWKVTRTRPRHQNGFPQQRVAPPGSPRLSQVRGHRDQGQGPVPGRANRALPSSRPVGLARRSKTAIAAVARSSLVIIWHLLSDPMAATPTSAAISSTPRSTPNAVSTPTSTSSRPLDTKSWRSCQFGLRRYGSGSTRACISPRPGRQAGQRRDV
jgi:hypothetical protein